MNALIDEARAMTAKAAAALRSDALTAEQCSSLLAEIAPVRDKVDSRHAAIRKGGSEQQRIAATSPADVPALREEAEALGDLREVLHAQTNALALARKMAQAREASRDLPAMLESLAESVDRAEALEAELAEQRKLLRRQFEGIRQARGLAQQSGLPMASASPKLATRLLPHLGDLGERHADTVREGLGADQRQPAEPSRAEPCPA